MKHCHSHVAIQILKPEIVALLRLIVLIFIIGCVSKEDKDKTFKMKIDPPARVVKVLDAGRGDCLLIFRKGHQFDTISFYRHNPFTRQIDTLSTLHKKPNSFDLEIKYLKRINDTRYDSVFRLFYW